MSNENMITRLLGCTYPILSAPMAKIATGKLASAVSKAGGFGIIGVGYGDQKWIEDQFKDVQHNNTVGVGFVTWVLHQHPDLLSTVLDQLPKAIMFSYGDFKPFVHQVKSRDILIIAQVQTVHAAIEAVDAGADIIVAQGTEAGGHVGKRGTFALVPAIVDRVNVPVIAAGGIADSRGMVAAQALGAGGILMGTRFYASTEAGDNADAQKYIIQSYGDDTICSRLVDNLRGVAWPEEYPGRTISNPFLNRLSETGEKEITVSDVERNIFSEAIKQKDYQVAPVFAGECIDLIDEVLPVETIIKNMVSGANEITKNMNK